jgi:hypothetical protein
MEEKIVSLVERAAARPGNTTAIVTPWSTELGRRVQLNGDTFLERQLSLGNYYGKAPLNLPL